MTLEVSVEKAQGTFSLAAEFSSGGGVTALFGPSGAGKSTLANMIAGLVVPDRGRIVLDDAVLFDSDQRVDLPVWRRRIGYVFQEGRLFPHYSVRGNLLYGRRRTPRKLRWGAFEQVVDLLGIAPLLKRRPLSLSGGEKQRVAIGRALLASPRLLLMDEPLASLDAARKAEIIPYIERLRDEMRLPIVYVSHSVGEVTRLADTLVLLADGKVVASGAVNDVFARLDLRSYTGQFEASVVLTARVVAHDGPSASTALDHPAGRMWISTIARPAGAEVRLRVRARDVAIGVGELGLLSIRNRLAATVREVAAGPAGSVEILLDAGGEPLIARISRDAAKALEIAVGQPVVALIKSAALDRLDDFS